MEVTGGRDPARAVGEDGARAYLGITMPGFPNLFCIYGPNTNSNQGTIPTMGSELQTRYALECIEGLFRTASHSIDLTPDAYEDYNQRLDEGLQKTIFSDPRLDTYYINEHGRSSSQTCWSRSILADDQAPRPRRLRAVLRLKAGPFASSRSRRRLLVNFGPAAGPFISASKQPGVPLRGIAGSPTTPRSSGASLAPTAAVR